MAADIAGWMRDQIWPQIHTLLIDDSLIKLMGKAQELTGEFSGPIGNMFIAGYVTSQTLAVRRLCDNGANVISLRRVLKELKKGRLTTELISTALSTKLSECDHICKLADKFIAHRADPGCKWNGLEWQLTSDHLAEARRALCIVAAIVDRDVLKRLSYAELMPVAPNTIMSEFRCWVPSAHIATLWEFWHANRNEVNSWLP